MKYLNRFFGAILVAGVLLCTPVISFANTTEISTTVPETHTVTIDAGEHGTVIVMEQKHRNVSLAMLPRLSKPIFFISPDEGWDVQSVYYGKQGFQEPLVGENNLYKVKEELRDDDEIFTVTYEKSSIVKTGDDNQIALFVLLLSLAALGLWITWSINKQTK